MCIQCTALKWIWSTNHAVPSPHACTHNLAIIYSVSLYFHFWISIECRIRSNQFPCRSVWIASHKLSLLSLHCVQLVSKSNQNSCLCRTIWIFNMYSCCSVCAFRCCIDHIAPKSFGYWANIAILCCYLKLLTAESLATVLTILTLMMKFALPRNAQTESRTMMLPKWGTTFEMPKMHVLNDELMMYVSVALLSFFYVVLFALRVYLCVNLVLFKSENLKRKMGFPLRSLLLVNIHRI